jgi:hypothetical protein
MKEAINSPLLLSDLANMEKYISESYQGRSLIELLQNADDALATKFLIKKASQNVYVVANNGRKFDNEDVLSICRSGASTKQRKGNSIGFRGIGFKSVVNYAQCVHLISGEIKLSFSKNLTKEILGDNLNVPLIRIPHTFKEVDKYTFFIRNLVEEGYDTIFIFEVNSDALSIEMDEFDSTTMLFLQNITEINFSFDSKIENYKINREQNLNNMQLAFIKSHNRNSNWLILNDNNICSIAFQIDDNLKAVKMNKLDSVVHSFMPTKDYTGMPIKFNGNFSTDPSRTKIIIDDETLIATKNCIAILIELITNIISSEEDQYGIIGILGEIEKDALSIFKTKRINDIIINELQDSFKNIFKLKFNSNHYNKFYIQPSWLDSDDFLKICQKNNILGFGESIEKKIPNILHFLNNFGFEKLPLEMAISNSNDIKYSLESRAKIFAQIVKKYRFGFNDDIKKSISKANLLEFETGCKSIETKNESDKLSPSFYTMLINLIADEKDLLWLLKKFDLYNDSTGTFSIGDKALMKNNNISTQDPLKLENLSFKNDSLSELFEGENIVHNSSFNEKPIFQKWRTVEENVSISFENMKNVVKVTDVSKSNLGYDLEVQWKDKIDYIEVKSVIKLGNSFSMTNNEYATAIEYGDNYALIIAEQSKDSMKMCIIYNPISKLTLIKRVTRWEWVCNEYNGSILNKSFD